MAIELTTASDSTLKRIRDSLKAIGVSGSNSFTLNGNMLGTGSIFLTGVGNEDGLHVPNGGIFIGYSAGGGWGGSNDGGEIRFFNPSGDDGELRVETRDNGNEAIVFRMRDEVSSIIYEPLVIGKNKNIGINVPSNTRNFANALTVYGNISASGNLFVDSIVTDPSKPFTIDVSSSSSALRVTQRGTGNAIEVEDDTNPDSTLFRVTSSGNVGIGTSSDRGGYVNGAKLNIVTGVGGDSRRAINLFRTGNDVESAAAIYYHKTRGANEYDQVIVQNEDVAVSFQGNVSNGIEYREVGGFRVRMHSTLPITQSSLPSEFIFYTTNQNETFSREVARIDHAGRLGIGTSSPTESLTVVGNISASGNLYVQSTISNSPSPLVVDVDSSQTALRVTQRGSGNAFVVEDSANPDETQFVITSAGRVGIGTTTVPSKLTVSGGISASGQVRVGEFIATREFRSHDPEEVNKNELVFNIGESYAYAINQEAEYLYVNAERGLMVNSSPDNWGLDVGSSPEGIWERRNVAVLNNKLGRTGLGTESPNEKLTVVGNISASGFIYGTGIGGGTGREDVNTSVISSSANWNNSSSAVIANSANWNTSFSLVSANDLVYSNPARETSSTGMSAVRNIVAMTQTGYDTLAVKLSSTLYIII